MHTTNGFYDFYDHDDRIAAAKECLAKLERTPSTKVTIKGKNYQGRTQYSTNDGELSWNDFAVRSALKSFKEAVTRSDLTLWLMTASVHQFDTPALIVEHAGCALHKLRDLAKTEDHVFGKLPNDVLDEILIRLRTNTIFSPICWFE